MFNLLLYVGVAAHDLRAVCDVISDFGAAGDNTTEDTAAIRQALSQCSKVVLRAGRTFLLRPLELRSHRHLVVDGNIAAWREISTWPNSTRNVCAITGYLTPPSQAVLVPNKEALLWGVGPLLNLTVSGRGTLDGQGWRWWPLKNDTSHGEYWHNCRPKLMSLGQMNVTQYGSVSDVQVSGVTFKDSPFWTLAGRGLRNATFRGVTVTTGGCGYDQAPNTDGFNLQGEDIVVEDSIVRNGDDCVPIFPPSRNVLVRNVTCICGNPPVALIWPASNHLLGPDPYHVGDVVNVHFDGIRLYGTSSGLALKSLPLFVGTARNVSFTNFVLHDVKLGMALNFFNQGVNAGLEHGIEAKLGASASDILIENVTGSVSAVGDKHGTGAGHINCRSTEPCTGLRLVNIQLVSTKVGSPVAPYSCTSANGTFAACSPVPCGWHNTAEPQS
jgi:polygalacturonase